ncbi:MAG TPA: NADH-quinone oxidoreductase subunit C, partial [Devosia sp.]|nr:NADH-quinone oxidoreductase subunit C [Devosia sp.]
MDDVTSLSPLRALEQRARTLLGDRIEDALIAFDQLTLTLRSETIVDAVRMLRDDPALRFVAFVDICG